MLGCLSSSRYPMPGTYRVDGGRTDCRGPSQSLMKTMKTISRAALALTLLALPAAFAADAWGPGGSLDACIAATLKSGPALSPDGNKAGAANRSPTSSAF